MKTQLSVGEWVEIRSKEEILATLDRQGQLDSLPFMPSMFQYCGRRFKVFKRAHKTCDTVNRTGGRRMSNAVHLEGLRCDGASYGGCQAGCLIFWKEAWLKRVDHSLAAPQPTPRRSSTGSCTEADVIAGTRDTSGGSGDETKYVCQATQIPRATTPLAWWDLSQYLEDYQSGNVGLRRLACGFVYACYYNLSESGIGLGAVMRRLYNAFQAVWGGIPYPRLGGTIPAGQRTPSATLNLQPGEFVRVRRYAEILATLDTDHKNRGLLFDAEAVPYCEGTYRVARRVQKILDERTGILRHMKTDSIVLQDVYCQSRYSDCRMFCPRSIDSYWREIWLERIPGAAPGDRPVATDPAVNKS
jgi:hypothetical protein